MTAQPWANWHRGPRFAAVPTPALQPAEVQSARWRQGERLRVSGRGDQSCTKQHGRQYGLARHPATARITTPQAKKPSAIKATALIPRRTARLPASVPKFGTNPANNRYCAVLFRAIRERALRALEEREQKYDIRLCPALPLPTRGKPSQGHDRPARRNRNHPERWQAGPRFASDQRHQPKPAEARLARHRLQCRHRDR